MFNYYNMFYYNMFIFCTEAKGIVMEFIKSAQRDFPNEWNSMYSELPIEVTTNIQRIFS